jgi:hypothetical protein
MRVSSGTVHPHQTILEALNHRSKDNRSAIHLLVMALLLKVHLEWQTPQLVLGLPKQT